MDQRARRDVAAWLAFYRDLGIEEFYHRPAASRNLKTETGDSPLRTGGSRVESQGPRIETGDSNLEAREPISPPGRGVSGEASRTQVTGTVPASPPSLIKVAPPVQALHLFEAPPSLPRKDETLEQIRADLGDCRRCRLASGRKTIVFGQGNPKTELVFVGEGPGADEDEQGLPFVGRAGQLLNRLLQSVGIKREDVYICNVVKCRPPGNRTPESDEIEACSPFLFRQIQSIRPRLVCCLGAPAVRTLLGVKEGITKIRGRFYDFAGTKALATVHPAYILRNPREEHILREDFQKILEFLKAP